MAEVFGDIGGQPVTLNNAATEATLKQLVQAIGILSAKSGQGGGKSQADVEKELKTFQQQLGKTSKSSAKTNKDLDVEQKNRKALAEQIGKEDAARTLAEKRTIASVGAVRGFTNALEGGVTKLTGMMSQLAGMGNSFTGAAAAFNSVPLIGGMLGSVFGAIATSGDKVFNTFKQAASVGANFNGNIRELVNAASGAGLTMDQFSAIIQKNGESLALMGGSATAGAKQLAAAGKAIRNSRVGDDLARLGFSTEDINNGIAKFGGMMARTGKQMDQTALAKISGEYMKNLAVISELTGKNKDALQAESDARMADAQYRLMLAKLDPEGAKNLEMLMNSIPTEHQAGLKEIMATGTAVSEEAQAAMAYMSKTGQSAMALGEQMRSSGTLTKSQAIEFDKARQGEMKAIAKEAEGRGGLLNVIGNFGNAVDQKFTVGVLNAAARTKDLGQALTEQEQAQKDAAKAQKDSLDPAQMQKLQQAIAETSNKFTVLLAQNLPKLQSAFDSLMKIIDSYVVPAFKLLMDNFELVVGAIVLFKGALALASIAMKAAEFYKSFKGPGTNRLNPMYVTDIGGGLGGSDRRGKKGGKAGRASKAATAASKGAAGAAGAGSSLLKGVGRAAGPVGAALALGMAANEFSDINKAEKAGEITKEKAKEEKGGIIGEGVGGMGGALLGGKAGATLGAIGGPVGAAIGGVLGAIGGGLIGAFGGKKAGKAVAATPAENKKASENYNNSNEFAGMEEQGTVSTPADPKVAKVPTAPDTSKVTEVNTTPATPKDPINFNTRDPLALLKSVQSSTPKPTTTQPAAAAEAARKTLENKVAEEKENAAEMERLANKTKAAAGPTTNAATTAQESTDSAIAMLNTHMAELVRISKANNRIGEKQLSVQEGLGGDLFSNVMA
jgi:hypothetical protein